MEANINKTATIAKFFFGDSNMSLAEKMLEMKQLTQEDKNELLEGIIKINGEMVYVK